MNVNMVTLLWRTTSGLATATRASDRSAVCRVSGLGLDRMQWTSSSGFRSPDYRVDNRLQM